MKSLSKLWSLRICFTEVLNCHKPFFFNHRCLILYLTGYLKSFFFLFPFFLGGGGGVGLKFINWTCGLWWPFMFCSAANWRQPKEPWEFRIVLCESTFCLWNERKIYQGPTVSNSQFAEFFFQSDYQGAPCKHFISKKIHATSRASYAARVFFRNQVK